MKGCALGRPAARWAHGGALASPLVLGSVFAVISIQTTLVAARPSQRPQGQFQVVSNSFSAVPHAQYIGLERSSIDTIIPSILRRVPVRKKLPPSMDAMLRRGGPVERLPLRASLADAYQPVEQTVPPVAYGQQLATPSIVQATIPPLASAQQATMPPTVQTVPAAIRPIVQTVQATMPPAASAQAMAILPAADDRQKTMQPALDAQSQLAAATIGQAFVGTTPPPASSMGTVPDDSEPSCVLSCEMVFLAIAVPASAAVARFMAMSPEKKEEVRKCRDRPFSWAAYTSSVPLTVLFLWRSLPWASYLFSGCFWSSIQGLWASAALAASCLPQILALFDVPIPGFIRNNAVGLRNSAVALATSSASAIPVALAFGDVACTSTFIHL